MPTVKCGGKVTRIEYTQPHSILRIATEFTGIDEHEKKIINTTFEEALAGQ
jgi:hypothetical protein